jgi:ribose transport system substrate-binding protein
MNTMECRTRPIMAHATDLHGCRSWNRRYFFRNCVVASFCFSGVLSGYSQGLPSSHAKTLATSSADPLLEAQRIVAEASVHSTSWHGPQSGPAAQPGKTIVFLAQDLRNGGILGVAQGVREAAKVIGWKVKIFDAGGTAAGRSKMMADALAARPDGVILGGDDAKENSAALAQFASRGVPVVGWHVGPVAGPIPGTAVAMNVTTDPMAVARVTAMSALAQSKGQAGVVVFTDSRFGIAMAKANAMADIIRACNRCTLLEVRDLALSESGDKMPAATKELLAKYGKRWTHALAINDIYFDYATPVLTKAGLASNGLSLLSAGDGSMPAFLRIQAGTFQAGTVAEPLNLHGWQVVDELNRLFAHQPVSGFVAPVHLVTTDNIAFDGGKRLLYDPDNGYRDIYRRIWTH